VITDWHNRRIDAGQNWENEIDNRLATTDLIALLLSPDFMASNYSSGSEMKRALEQHATKLSEIIPLVVRKTNLTNTPFSHLQSLPKDASAISDFENRALAYDDVAVGIRSVVDRIRYRRAGQLHETDPRAAAGDTRIFDAIAKEIPLGLSREVAVQVRVRASEGLALTIERDQQGGKENSAYTSTPADVKSSDEFQLPWLRDDLLRGDRELLVRLDAGELSVRNAEKKIAFNPGGIQPPSFFR
jgi:hypothetical protein